MPPRCIFGRSTRRFPSSKKLGPFGQGMSIWVSTASRLRWSAIGSVMTARSEAAGASSSRVVKSGRQEWRRSEADAVAALQMENFPRLGGGGDVEAQFLQDTGGACPPA